MSLDPVMPPYNASDPSASFLSSSCLDFLLIELVPLAYRVTQARDGDDAAAVAEAKKNRAAAGADASDDALPDMSEDGGADQRASSTGATTAAGSMAGGKRFDEEDEELDAVHYRLETLGYRVGQGLVERYVPETIKGCPYWRHARGRAGSAGSFAIPAGWTATAGGKRGMGRANEETDSRAIDPD